MNVTSRLAFDFSPGVAGLGIAVIVVTAVLGVIACRRMRWRRSVVGLESVRLAVVCFCVALLGGPQWVRSQRPDSRPVVAVLVDDSASMTTRDVTGGGDLKSRDAIVAPLGEMATWGRLGERAEVLVQRFGGDSNAVSPPRPASGRGGRGVRGSSAVNDQGDIPSPPNPLSPKRGEGEPESEFGTDIGGVLSAATSIDNLLGVVLISDGDWNAGDSPAVAATRLRTMGVPVHTIAVGSDTRLPDIEVLSFDVPTFATAGKVVRLPITLQSSLPRDHAAVVTLKTSDGETITKDIRVAAMGRTTDWIDWQPETLGDVMLTVDVPPQPSEVRTDNNSATSPIAIRQEKLRVLVIESVPRWEYRYLRNALSRDPGVEVSCLLFQPGLDKHGGGNADYIDAFPATKEELARFDVVFLGDVGLQFDQLTLQQCEWLAGLVRQQASGLVFLPGLAGRQFSLLETPLAELIPAELDESQPGGWGSRTAEHFELTELGRRSLLTKLADTPEENLGVWQNLPGFQWYAPIMRAKPGTETLAVHAEASNRYGRIPLLVTRTYGAGKVLLMATDGAWRWRKGVEDLYHYRFWGQVVRWMAYRRNMIGPADSGEQRMRMYYSPEQPRVRQTMTFEANVMERSGEPLAGGDVTLQIRWGGDDRPEAYPTGLQTVRLTSTGSEWGAFAGRFTPTRPGMHELTLFCKQTGDSLQTSVLVTGEPLEQIGRPARPDVMAEIARVSGGRTLTADRTDEVIDLLAAMPDRPPVVARTAIWSHPATLAVLVVLLAMFWIGRKAAGLF